MVTISRVVPPSASHARSPPFLSRSSAGVCRRRAPQLTNTRASRSSPLRESRKLATFTAVEARSSHHHVEFWRSALWPSRADLNTVLEYGTKGGAMRRAGAAVVGDRNRLAPRQGGARRISRRLAPPLAGLGRGPRGAERGGRPARANSGTGVAQSLERQFCCGRRTASNAADPGACRRFSEIGAQNFAQLAWPRGQSGASRRPSRVPRGRAGQGPRGPAP